MTKSTEFEFDSEEISSVLLVALRVRHLVIGGVGARVVCAVVLDRQWQRAAYRITSSSPTYSDWWGTRSRVG